VRLLDSPQRLHALLLLCQPNRPRLALSHLCNGALGSLQRCLEANELGEERLGLHTGAGLCKAGGQLLEVAASLLKVGLQLRDVLAGLDVETRHDLDKAVLLGQRRLL